MTKSIETMLKIQAKIVEIRHDLDFMSGFTDAEMADERLGKDMDALTAHLDKAAGRASTVVDDLRKLEISQGFFHGANKAPAELKLEVIVIRR